MNPLDRIPKPVMLLVMDGVGIRESKEHNAVKMAHAPTLARLKAEWPHATLLTSGTDVGLFKGQMGNSEVGHQNLGAGRVVWQDVMEITQDIIAGEFDRNETLNQFVCAIRDGGGRIHVMGLVGDGAIHAMDEHQIALLRLCAKNGMHRDKVAIHVITDGRDTPPESGAGYVKYLQKRMDLYDVGVIATVSGRYFAMDRDKRWDRTQLAWDAIVGGKAKYTAPSGEKAVLAAYERFHRKESNETDEFIVPTVIVGKDGKPVATIRDGDGVIWFNFRADRGRQMCFALTQEDFKGFERKPWPKVTLATMTHYHDDLKVPQAFPQTCVPNTMPEIVSRRQKRQLRITETEKYPHVTFFFSGRREQAFEGEDRIMVPSPRDVKTYDERPAMSAVEITDRVLPEIASGKYDFILMNYANGDMVGHTGVLGAAIQAVETVDKCLARVVPAVLNAGGALFLTSDHGNSEEMWDHESNCPHTQHTLNPVPCFLIGKGLESVKLRDGGRLADVAPTLLELLKLPAAPEMTGKSLIA